MNMSWWKFYLNEYMHYKKIKIMSRWIISIFNFMESRLRDQTPNNYFTIGKLIEYLD